MQNDLQRQRALVKQEQRLRRPETCAFFMSNRSVQVLVCGPNTSVLSQVAVNKTRQAKTGLD